jgi:diguanylate cyclase (GGDEF)-like protein/PAS domain S-box-containing protein
MGSLGWSTRASSDHVTLAIIDRHPGPWHLSVVVKRPTTPPGEAADDPLRALHDALGALMRSEALGRGDLPTSLAQVTEYAARLVGVQRASVWRLSAAGEALELLDLHSLRDGSHQTGIVLHASDAPRYFAALQAARVIAAADAHTDPSTAEFSASYLNPLGIGAMLDAPVVLYGKVAGVLCLEHVGGPREWLPWQQIVAGSLADFVSAALAAHDHVEQARVLDRYHDHLEQLVDERTRELEQARADLRNLFDLAPVPLVASRLSDQVLLDGNRRAEAMFEVTRDAIGRPAPDFWARPADRERLRAQVARDGRVDGFEAELVSSSGRHFWCELSAAVLDFDGAPALIIGGIDITRRKEADAAHQVLEAQLREMANTDGLTGALNRRRLFEVGELELARANRYDRALTVAMIDVDHFKVINDELGHAVGDEALRTLVRVIKSQVRKSDVVARYGGEEFVVLLPETTAAAAALTLERVRRLVGETMLSGGDGSSRNMTISIGLASRREGQHPEQHLDALLARVDAAMYRAKAAGRDRLVVD